MQMQPSMRLPVSFVGLLCGIFLGLLDRPTVADTTAVDAPVATSNVGMPQRIEQVVIPGSLLEVKPLEDRHAPLVLRIAKSYPHGSDHRYDLEYYALEPGSYDLTQYLQRVDGSTHDLDPLTVEVASTLPSGQVTPYPLQPSALPTLGGYRVALVLGFIVWLAGLTYFLLTMRRRLPPLEPVATRQRSLADRLRPLVRRARDGSLDDGQKAQLERLLIAYWYRRLKLNDMPPGEAFAKLKSHPQAGPLLTQLEQWLHAPNADPNVNLDSLLEPYEAAVDPDTETVASDLAQFAAKLESPSTNSAPATT